MWQDCGPRVLGIYFEPVRAEKIKQIAMSKDKETKKSEQEEVKEQPADAAGNGPQEATEGAGVKMAEEEAEKDSAAVKMRLRSGAISTSGFRPSSITTANGR